MMDDDEMSIRAIRSKSNPNLILSFGATVKGGLGEFDPEIWEEVELEALAEDYEMYTPPPLAQGSDLVKLAQQAFNEEAGLIRANLLHIFNNFPIALEKLEAAPLQAETKAKLQASATNGYIYFSLQDWLLSATCNPLAEADLDDLLLLLDFLPIELGKIKSTFINLIKDYQEQVIFK